MILGLALNGVLPFSLIASFAINKAFIFCAFKPLYLNIQYFRLSILLVSLPTTQIMKKIIFCKRTFLKLNNFESKIRNVIFPILHSVSYSIYELPHFAYYMSIIYLLISSAEESFILIYWYLWSSQPNYPKDIQYTVCFRIRQHCITNLTKKKRKLIENK